MNLEEINRELDNQFRLIVNNYDPLDYFYRLICPELAGNENAKKAILLMLVSSDFKKGVRHRLHIGLVGEPGTGKSIAEDTPIIVKVEGKLMVIPIKDIERYKDIYVLSVNPVSLKVEWKKVKRIYKHKDNREVLKITTGGKQEIIATVDHSFYKFSFKENKMIPCRGDELKQNDLIPFISYLPSSKTLDRISFPANYGFVELKNKLHIGQETLKKLLPFHLYKKSGQGKWEIPYSDIKKRWKNIEKKFEYLDLTYGLGFATGFWLAEGTLTSSGIQFRSNNKEILNKIRNFLSHIKKLNTPKYYGGCISPKSLIVRHRLLYRYFPMFLDKNEYDNYPQVKGRGSRAKIIPSFCFYANNEFISGLLSGFFTGDGTIGKMGVYATTISKDLAYGICFLLWRLSIGAYVREKKYRYGGEERKAYYIVIPSYFMKDFYEKVGFMDNKKKRKLEERLKKKRFNSIVNIPFDKGFYKECIEGKNLCARDSKHRKFLQSIRRCAKKGRMSKDIASKFNSLIGSPVLDKLISSNIYWVPIKKIEKIKYDKYLYDIEVEGNHNFVLANGIITHNSVIMEYLEREFNAIYLTQDTSVASLKADARKVDYGVQIFKKANGGIVCIDEIELMKDRETLRDVMERGEVIYTKGGKEERYDAKVRIVVGANTFKNLSPALIDRLDFIFEFKKPDKEEAKRIARKVISLFNGKTYEREKFLLKGYLDWVRDFEPEIKDEEEIGRVFDDYFDTTGEGKSGRWVAKVMRIATAHAKLCKRDVTAEDVRVALRIINNK